MIYQVILTALLLSFLHAPSVRGACQVPVATEPIQIDGKLDESAWRNALHLTDFYLVEGKTTLRTEARILCSDSSLYIGLVAEDPHVKSLVTTVRKNGDRAYRDDSFELFLSPEFSQPHLLQVAVNSLGVTCQNSFGALYRQPTRKVLLEKAVLTTGSGFQIELKFSLDALLINIHRIDPQSPAIAINIVRNIRNPKHNRSQLSLAKGGAWDQATYCRFRLPLLPEQKRIVGLFPVTRKNSRKMRFKAGESVSKITLQRLSSAPDEESKPLHIKGTSLPEGETTFLLPLGLPSTVYELSVESHNFKHPYLLKCDPVVQLLPQFSIADHGDGLKKVILRLADHVDRKTLAGEIRLHYQGKVLISVKREIHSGLVMDLSSYLNPITEGWVKMTCRAEDGEGGVHEASTRFLRTPVLAVENDILRNGDLEETRPRNTPPRGWSKDSVKLYPDINGVYKKIGYWGWADTSVFPHSVFHGKRALVFQGKAQGTRMHIGIQRFEVDLNASYTLRLWARGEGVFKIRYYCKNRADRWLSEYFEFDKHILTNEWKEYVLAPVDFNKEIARHWDFTPVDPTDNKPHTAELVIAVWDDAFINLDTMSLSKKPK